MNRPLNREILRLALPSILANLTIPLVGMVDTGVAGHLTGGDAAAFIGAISVGAMLFNLLYWNFFFLRTGTGGLTAQAFGRGDFRECARIFWRGIFLALAIALVTLLFQWPFVELTLFVVKGSPEVESLAAEYFFARVWAAPATLCLMTFSGWFVGMQDSVSSMWKDLVVNTVNIAASIVLAFGIGDWEGMGFVGIAWGTVIAQYSGLLYCILVRNIKYGRKVFSLFSWSDIGGLLRKSELREYFRLNLNLLGRSVCFTVIYMGYTMLAARYGDVMLSCSALMMQLLMIFSYFTDGFAYAGEALTGRFIGEGNREMVRSTVKYVFVWSMAIAVAFIGVYQVGGVPLLRLLTSDSALVDSCRVFLPWLLLMPPIGCAAFTWDGIYLGATAAKPIFRAMLGATAVFALVCAFSVLVLESEGELEIHMLLAAYFFHLIYRTVYLGVKRKAVLNF